MTLVAGANVKTTSFGFALPDGGFAAIRNGNLVFAIAEERLSRQKKDGGFRNALKLFNKQYRTRGEAIDLLVTSSCCDEVGAPPVEGFVGAERLLPCGHHQSHAIGSFSWSGYEDALVVVLDSGGDTFAPVRDGSWWSVGREQHSIFYFHRKQFELIARHADQAFDFGFWGIVSRCNIFLRVAWSTIRGKYDGARNDS